MENPQLTTDCVIFLCSKWPFLRMSQLLAIEKAVQLPCHVLEYAAILRRKRAFQCERTLKVL
jgi:hypothetical protein